MNKKKPNEFDIINYVYKICYDKEFINDKMIIGSFKITGISISLDGSENHLIKFYKELSDEIYIPSELLDESNKILNDYELKMDNIKKKVIKVIIKIEKLLIILKKIIKNVQNVLKFNFY